MLPERCLCLGPLLAFKVIRRVIEGRFRTLVKVGDLLGLLGLHFPIFLDERLHHHGTIFVAIQLHANIAIICLIGECFIAVAHAVILGLDYSLAVRCSVLALVLQLQIHRASMLEVDWA